MHMKRPVLRTVYDLLFAAAKRIEEEPKSYHQGVYIRRGRPGAKFMWAGESRYIDEWSFPALRHRCVPRWLDSHSLRQTRPI